MKKVIIIQHYTLTSSKSTNKKIRRSLDDTELGEETKRKIAMEKERQERLKSLKAQFSGVSMMNMSTCRGSLPEGATSKVLGDASTGFIVNVVREQGEEAVRIPPSISAILKTHQVVEKNMAVQSELAVWDSYNCYPSSELTIRDSRFATRLIWPSRMRSRILRRLASLASKVFKKHVYSLSGGFIYMGVVVARYRG